MNLGFIAVVMLVLAGLAVAGLVIFGQAITRRSHDGRISARTAALLRAVAWTMIPVLGFVAFPGSLPTPLFLMVIVGTFALSAFPGLRGRPSTARTDERTV